MAYNLKKFATEADYNSAISSLNYPAVSWVESGDTLHYDLTQPPAPKVVATYNVTTTSKPTIITENKALSGISKMYVDGVELPNVVDMYTFSTTGTHTVEFELADSTKIPYRMFYTSGYSLRTVLVPSSVTSFEDYAFCGGPVDSLTIEATVPPTLLGSNSLVYEKTAPTIYVPAASVSAYQSASGFSTYSANIQAIP